MKTVGIALTDAEQALVVRAVRDLVEREGATDTAHDVLQMLAQAVPAFVFAALIEEDAA